MEAIRDVWGIEFNFRFVPLADIEPNLNAELGCINTSIPVPPVPNLLHTTPDFWLHPGLPNPSQEMCECRVCPCLLLNSVNEFGPMVRKQVFEWTGRQNSEMRGTYRAFYC